VGRRALWLAVYAVAMGVLEAVVVVYLRALLYPAGFAFPLVAIPAPLAAAEVAREAMTLVMLLAVAALAGRDGVDRFFVFGLLFGAWDLAYYAGLYVALGWPPSLLTWDILFLIPVPWTAPVLYPALVSVVLVLGFAGHEMLRTRGRRALPSVAEWSCASLGCLAIVAAFCFRFRVAVEGGVPRGFPVALFTAGLLLGTAPIARAMLRALKGTATLTSAA
jgi:hypothetical protein